MCQLVGAYGGEEEVWNAWCLWSPPGMWPTPRSISRAMRAVNTGLELVVDRGLMLKYV
jgi:hypothetical protein